MNKDEALRQALEALEKIHKHPQSFWNCMEEITAIKQALEQSVATNDTSQTCVDETAKQRHEPEPEPVARGVDWGNAGDSSCVSIIKRLPDGVIEVVAVEYGPKREPLTDDELKPICDEYRILFGYWVNDFARAIEAKLKAKNGFPQTEKNT